MDGYPRGVNPCTSGTWPDQLVCLVRELNRGPSAFDWASQIWIPLLLAIASITVATVSWRTSRRAVQIAKDASDAEATRASKAEAREKARDDWDYAKRLDEGMVGLIEAVGTYAFEVDSWVDEASDIEVRWSGDPDDTPYPPLPSTAQVYSRLHAAMIFSRGDDRIPMGLVDGFVRDVIASRSRWKTSSRLNFLAENLRTWRDGSTTSKTFISRLRRKRDTIRKDRDTPPPRTFRL